MYRNSPSWSRKPGVEGLIATKRIDWSIFEYGIHIPVEYRRYFEDSGVDVDIMPGQSRSIRIALEDITYEAELRAIKHTNTDETGTYHLQIRYDRNQELKQHLIKIFQSSYYYILREKFTPSELKKRAIIVQDDEAEFIDIIAMSNSRELTFIPKTKEVNFWVFQANPNKYDIIKALSNNHVTKWSVRSHKDKISIGDKAIIWVTGQQSGCYALAKVTSEPYSALDDEQSVQYYQVNQDAVKELRCDIEVEMNMVHNPLTKEVLLNNPMFEKFKGGNQGTNFEATSDQFYWLMEKAIETRGENMYQAFIAHIGDETDLRNYNRSYKMVMIMAFLKLMDSTGRVIAMELARYCKNYYESRIEKGFPADYEVNSTISRINESSIASVLSHFKGNPYESFHRFGFMDLSTDGEEEYFKLNDNIVSKLTPEEKEELIKLHESKLTYYYSLKENPDLRKQTDSFRDLLLKVMVSYVQTRNHEPFGGNQLASLIRKDIPDLIKDYGFIKKKNYSPKGSPGQGNWAKIPWIAVFNPSITTTSQDGVYIVYLFSEDMSNLYLTLNQGCTKINNENNTAETINILKSNAANIRSIIRNEDSSIHLDDDVLIGNEFYERGTIAYKKYLAEQMPNEETLIKDLENFVDLYHQYYEWTTDNTKREVAKMDPDRIKNEESKPKNDDSQGENKPKQVIPDPYDSVKDEIERIKQYIAQSGFTFKNNTIENFYLCLKAKPFVLLAGTSGTGKTRLVRLFAEAIGATVRNGRYKMIPVKPDWSDATDLLGYKDLNGKFHAGVLTNIIVDAQKNSQFPYIVCLDEMNLARVEYYFSDVLSVLETRHFEEGGVSIVTDPIIPREYLGDDEEAMEKFSSLIIPDNVYFVGTVNMDESTFPFSKKVLDRANTIEFSYVDLDLPEVDQMDDAHAKKLSNDFLKSKYIILNDCIDEMDFIREIITELKRLNNVLEEAQLHFGYRIRDEVCFYGVYNNEDSLMEFADAVDHMILQKILPRIQGSSPSIKSALLEVFKICVNDSSNRLNPDSILHDEMIQLVASNTQKTGNYFKSAEKIAYMMRRYEEDGFTSFWI